MGAHSIAKIGEFVSHHETDPPRLVLPETAHDRQHLGIHLRRGKHFPQSNAIIHSQNTDRVLVILRQLHKQRNKLCLDKVHIHLGRQLPQTTTCCLSDHRGVVATQLGKQTTELLLCRGWKLVVYEGKYGGGSDACCVEVSCAHPPQKRRDILLKVLLRQNLGEKSNGGNSLVSDRGLFHGRQRFQGNQNAMSSVVATHVINDMSKLF
mmetsp:Transcript_26096/g.60215  ORF Transcript_26096/g.60215 Transcript_26096/m.60215 type:complete len:208 (-) Transcript_26096:318-941(-)